MTRNVRLTVVLAAVALGVAWDSSALPIGQDEAFNNTDWTSVVTLGSPSSFVNGQVAAGGNPGAYRQTDVTAGSTINSTHISSAITWDPSTQGALTILHFSFDGNYLSASPAVPIDLEPILRQGGVIFAPNFDATPPPSLGGGWQNLQSSPLGQANFIDSSSFGGTGTLQPDFSATGGLIEFGYALGFGPGSFTTSAGIDNYLVAPEPTTIWLLASGLVGLAFWRPQRT